MKKVIRPADAPASRAAPPVRFVKTAREIRGTLEAAPDGAGGAVLRLLDERGKIILTVGVPAPGKREVKYWNSVSWGGEAWEAVRRVMGGKG